MNKEAIRQKIIVPVVFSFLILLAGAVFGLYKHQNSQINKDIQARLNSIQQMFRQEFSSDAELIHGLIDFIKEDKNLQNAWLSKNRDELLRYSKPIFEHFTSEFRITHFYFHNLDKVNFLRVHKPSRYGDFVDRFTMNEASEKGKESKGIELGPLGTFTLRVVQPWLINGELSGYIELGEEIAHFTPRLRRIIGAELVFVINKQHLDRAEWEEGLKMLGHIGNWDDFSDFVVIDSTIEIDNSIIEKIKQNSNHEHENIRFSAGFSDRNYIGGFVSLTDAAGHVVGDIIVLNDVTDWQASLRKLITAMVVICLLVGAALFLFFYIYVGNIENRLLELHSNLNNKIEKLREARRFSEGVIESSRDGIIIVDVMGNVLSSNTTIERFSGLSKEEIKGKHVSELIADDEDVRKNIREKTVELFEKGYATYDALYKAKEGNLIEVECISSMIKDDKGDYTGGVSIIRDITERKRLEAKLQRAEKMETIGTLAGGVAHDLNNTLGAIVGYPDLLLDDIPEDSPLRSGILAIKQSGERAAEIVQDLLTLTRRGVVVTEIVSLNTIISKSLETHEYNKLKEFNPDIVIETDLDAELLNITGSPMHLSKTVMNLVSNAAEAMPDGGIIRISTANVYVDSPIEGYETVKEGDYAVLRITDNGIGIAEEDLEKIFEPFYTKKKMGRSGTGLGMAVVWGTVKDHNGYIVTESTKGKGTTFKLYFPTTRQEVQESVRTVSAEEYTGNGEKVLVVDDVESQLEIASKILSKLNYSVKTVSSGEEAVKYMEDNTVDLLILDMIMDPGIDGLDTYKGVIETHPGQKAIIASGFSETNRVREARRLGADEYIKKPYTMEKIGIAVKAVLKKTK